MDIQSGFDKLNEVLGNRYYWLHTLHMGKLVISGPYRTKEKAYEMAAVKNDGGADWEIFVCSSRDQAKATQMIKQKVYNVTGDLNFSLQRASHDQVKPDETTKWLNRMAK